MRPNASLGDGCIVENCSVENSILMDGAHVSGVERAGWLMLGRDAGAREDSSSAHVMLLVGDHCVAQLR